MCPRCVKVSLPILSLSLSLGVGSRGAAGCASRSTRGTRRDSSSKKPTGVPLCEQESIGSLFFIRAPCVSSASGDPPAAPPLSLSELLLLFERKRRFFTLCELAQAASGLPRRERRESTLRRTPLRCHQRRAHAAYVLSVSKKTPFRERPRAEVRTRRRSTSTRARSAPSRRSTSSSPRSTAQSPTSSTRNARSSSSPASSTRSSAPPTRRPDAATDRKVGSLYVSSKYGASSRSRSRRREAPRRGGGPHHL